MRDDDKPGSLHFTSLHGVCDADKLGSLPVYALCAMTISLEVWKSTHYV